MVWTVPLMSLLIVVPDVFSIRLVHWRSLAVTEARTVVGDKLMG